MKDKTDSRTEDMAKSWPKKKDLSNEALFADWLKIHPGRRPPFWEWCHKKKTGEW